LEPNIFLESREMPRRGSDEKLLSMCGRLIERKRPWIAVHALADPRLRDYRLLVIGDGPLRGELTELADVLGVSGRITYVGRVDHQTAQSLVASTRALLHPAAREGAAWVVGEAAAMGVPAVVIEGGGAESTVRECANGGGIAKRDRRLHRQVGLYVDAVVDTLRRPRPEVSRRWEADRIPRLLNEWWL
jgi:glycosyltransferase involved in cell wall biosynthesis